MDNRSHRDVLLAALLCLLASAPGAAPTAQYAAADDAATVAEQFRNENTRRQRPRIALLWNRAFADDVATQYTDFVRYEGSTDSSSTRQSDTNSTGLGTAESATEETSRSSRSEVTSGARAEQTRARASVPEREAWQLETVFTQTLIGAGARVVDRAAIMRALHADKPAGERPDIQAIEAQALLGKADLLMEVLLTPSADAPARVTFRINVKDVRSGEVIASFTSNGMPRSRSSGSYRAASYGFEFQPPPPPRLDQVAEQLGNETLAHVLHAWRNAS